MNVTNDITKNFETYKKFLNSATNIYKYDFKKQLEIFTQNENATMVADINIWNRLGRVVLEGANSIELKNEQDGKVEKSLLFDISATKNIRKNEISIERWKPTVFDESNIKEILKKKLSKYDFVAKENATIYELVNKNIEYNVDFAYDNYDIDYYFESSFLEELPKEAKEKITKDIIKSSSAYITYNRLGLDTGLIDDESFREIYNFNTEKSFELIGEILSSTNNEILREIEKSVVLNKRERAEENERKRPTETRNESREQYIVREREELLDTSTRHRGNDEKSTRRTDRKVWSDETEISKGTSETTVQYDGEKGNAEISPNRSEAPLSEKRRTDNKRPDGGVEHNRRTETKRPDEVGRTNEQRAANSGRTYTRRDYLQSQINLFDIQPQELKNVDTQLKEVEEKEKSFSSTFVLETETKKNYQIDELTLSKGKKAKAKGNVKAIKVLINLEEKNIEATDDEKDILSRYVGWGGIPEIFDQGNISFKNEYSELKNLLSDEDYEFARASTLNAHYTSPLIIDEMYNTLIDNGFTSGNILEPAVGTGNFFGRLPGSLSSSDLTGVELDKVSGKITNKLYPNADIQIKGFEETNFSNNSFDLVISNVPFGDYSIYDNEHNKENLLIHDYFISKSLDKVKDGGMVAVITSSGTLDKQNTKAREEIANKADLVGAIRLPNTAFKENAGTEVTTDILFFQKRDLKNQSYPFWVYTSENNNGYKINNYFNDNPNMILGHMDMVSGQFGEKLECIPVHDTENEFKEMLKHATSNVTFEIDNTAAVKKESPIYYNDIPKHSYYLDNEKVMYKNAYETNTVELKEKPLERIKGLIEIRNLTRTLLHQQLEAKDNKIITDTRDKLNTFYDKFVKENGHINTRSNSLVFREDNSYHLLSSLEILDKSRKNVIGKADMFSKNTIIPVTIITEVDTPSEALMVSLQSKGKVDIEYMLSLLDSKYTKEEMLQELRGLVFLDPGNGEYVQESEYLSENVRNKLEIAKKNAEKDNQFNINVDYLNHVQPEPLSASEIFVQLGSSWIAPEYYKKFLMEYLNIHVIMNDDINLEYNDFLNDWTLKVKDPSLKNRSLMSQVFGTKRKNAFSIFADTINLKNVQVFDIISVDGKDKRVLNAKETAIALEKQEQMKETFKEWIFKDPTRREYLTNVYNTKFNSDRTREYSGEHLNFPGMNPEIELRDHQKNGVARFLYGGNSLLAHTVGAGKTYTMIASAMEQKRIGLASKSLFVVPNHLIEQWGDDFRKLYPNANLLVATKQDFTPANRMLFCSRIATGEYEAVIIGHSQFERLPISKERQEKNLKHEIFDITRAIESATLDGSSLSVKRMESMKKSLETRLRTLNDEGKKDNVVTFEELGVDRLFIDEAHNYKNLFLYTKMRNIAGISQTNALKSSDMFAKCQYMNEITDNKGICFATGTPISNSMTEMYTMQRYLMYDKLREKGLSFFDNWASIYGETVTATELSPEGTGYRLKTRFAKFNNLPEVMTQFKEVADIQTADMLKLPTPKANYHNIVIKPSDFQKEMVEEFADRAERIRNGGVAPEEDNMLKITTDGRKLALDSRLMSPDIEPTDDNKVNKCANEVFNIWDKSKAEKSAQLIFCDTSTPKGKNSTGFTVYDEMKRLLMDNGIPENEVAFIHDANTDIQKSELFEKVRQGDIRVLLGSTSKLGAGTNVQDKLIALHHLDVPWKPADIEQQEGRMLRQGNENKEVDIFKYVTEGTFDAYSWQLIENKQRFISQIMTSKTPSRSCEDIDEAVLSYAEIKALATGNPLIKEKMDLDIEVSKLKILKDSFLHEIYSMEDKLLKHIPKNISYLEKNIEKYEEAIEKIKNYEMENGSDFKMVVNNSSYTERVDAGKEILKICSSLHEHGKPANLGSIMGFELELVYDTFANAHNVNIKDMLNINASLSKDPAGIVARISNMMNSFPAKLENTISSLAETREEKISLEIEVKKSFPREQEYIDKSKKLKEVEQLLSQDPGKKSDVRKEKEIELAL